jgi:hypothetical protein
MHYLAPFYNLADFRAPLSEKRAIAQHRVL